MPAIRNTRPTIEADILKDGRLLKSLARHQMRKVNMSVPETHREKTVSLRTACMGDDCGDGGGSELVARRTITAMQKGKSSVSSRVRNLFFELSIFVLVSVIFSGRFQNSDN